MVFLLSYVFSIISMYFQFIIVMVFYVIRQETNRTGSLIGQMNDTKTILIWNYFKRTHRNSVKFKFYMYDLVKFVSLLHPR